jgi:hypothetical protein
MICGVAQLMARADRAMLPLALIIGTHFYAGEFW